MTTNVSKSQLNSVTRQLNNKAQSWGQVCKQLSGMTGKVEIEKGEKISIKEAFCLLGVHTKGNKYTPADIQLAWSERLKEGQTMHTTTAFTPDAWRCPLISRAMPIEKCVDGENRRLYTKDKQSGKYIALKKHELCRVVKAEDKRKGSTDVIVTAKVLLQGLVQSIYVEDTLNEIVSEQRVSDNITAAYVNLGTPDVPNWVLAQKHSNGVWSTTPEKHTYTVEVKGAKKAPKRGNKKAA